MNRFIRAINIISSFGAALGGFVLIFIMLLTISTVVYRFFGGVIVGSYELTELTIIVAVGFALVYTTRTDSNVTVKILLDHFGDNAKRCLSILANLLALGFWGWMAWETFFDTLKRGMSERTEVFLFSLLPIKMIWVFALAVMTLVLVASLLSSIVGRTDR
ncbi:MAG: TRAP transporter small permease [Deltaproteobacteria bacterium]|nr:TRAP transporter small permease [Deltaproteobacteria bacterium]